jgi:hypothetical protein
VFGVEIPWYCASINKTITGLCIKLRASKSTRYLFFKFQEAKDKGLISGYPIEFAKEPTVDEFELMEDNPQYFVCHISCKSLQSFSLTYITIANMRTLTNYGFDHKTHHVNLQ